jgi:N-methylhydantoinase A/oxoprolinase/acetone carboxylase beta subunit
MLVNIDNGGTLTDICVIKDGDLYKTKTLITTGDY